MRLRKPILYLLAPAALLGTVFLVHVASTGSDGRRAGDHSTGLFWTPGDVQAYEVEIESAALIRLQGRNLPQSVRQRLAGTLHLRVFGVSDGEARVGFQLAPLRLALEGSAEGGAEKAGDGPPFLAVFDADGRVDAFVFPKTAPPRLRELLEEMIRTFQCVMPRGRKDRWTTRETHSTGAYTAAYTTHGGGTIKKRKTAYLGDNSSIVLDRSRALFELSATSWLERASLNERLQASGGEEVRVEHRNRAILTRIETAPPHRTALHRLGSDFESARGHVLQHDFPSSRSAQRPKLPKPTAKQVRSKIRGLNASDGDDATFIVELREQIVEDPGLTDVVVEAIEAEGTTDGTDAALINTLGLAGTEQAQEALVGILDSDTRRHNNRLRATVALGFVVDPNEGAFGGLWKAAEDRGSRSARDRSNTALLSLGTATGTLRVRKSARAATERARLAGRLSNASNAQETAIVLKALGNTRDLRLADEIAARLDDPNPDIRTAAAYSLRTMHSEATADVLGNKLRSETDASVRRALATSLSRLKTTSAAALAVVHAQIAKEEDEGTRYAMADLLSRHLGDLPACRDTLQEMLPKETSNRIRIRLAEAIYTPEKIAQREKNR